MLNRRVSDDTPLLALSTVDDEAVARSLARELLDAELVTCVNLVPGVTSMYRWQGRIEESREWLLLLKTSSSRWPALKQRLPALHPYDVPELIATEIVDGLEPYLRWLVSAGKE
ncbi:divalent-cation tolerance protein CutA [Caldimonas brevitalea]|uniref:Periplasmic divalent cation tolerance protein n=1 Tax=Caldimonas brevitalea TaxID=413882 RepID=A0A0G3BQ70_9BURK|nr:divalent-cation tolerance protein CutA [Caldimonas brevitalea]AKJ31567.1 periplasmic divalent cation tolerance protein [Caldimonas brevitalea]